MFPASVSCELCAAVTVLTLDLFSSGSHRDVQRSSEVKGRLHWCLQESGSGLQVRTGRLSCSPLIFGINTIWNKYSNTLLFFFKNVFPWSRELGDFESAMESFQKALMLNQNHIQSLQLRGMMLYHHGSLPEAIGNFKVEKKLNLTRNSN